MYNPTFPLSNLAHISVKLICNSYSYIVLQTQMGGCTWWIIDEVYARRGNLVWGLKKRLHREAFAVIYLYCEFQVSRLCCLSEWAWMFVYEGFFKSLVLVIELCHCAMLSPTDVWKRVCVSHFCEVTFFLWLYWNLT